MIEGYSCRSDTSIIIGAEIWRSILVDISGENWISVQYY